MTADAKYYLLNKDNLTQPIQIHLSKKQKTFSQYCSAFLEFGLNVEHLEKNARIIAYVFRKLHTVKDAVWEMSKKSCFRRPYGKQDGARAETLLKSPRKLYYLY